MHDSGESQDVPVCHTVNMTSLSICQPHDSSVCQPKHDHAWSSVCLSVCLLSVLSVQPSARFMVKILVSIAGCNFPKVQIPTKFLSVCTSLDSSVNPSGSLLVTSSLSAENPLKFPDNHGEKKAVNELHEILVKSPSVCTLLVMSIIAPVCVSSVPSIHLSVNEHQEILDKSPVLIMGRSYQQK